MKEKKKNPLFVGILSIILGLLFPIVGLILGIIGSVSYTHLTLPTICSV